MDDQSKNDNKDMRSADSCLVWHISSLLLLLIDIIIIIITTFRRQTSQKAHHQFRFSLRWTGREPASAVKENAVVENRRTESDKTIATNHISLSYPVSSWSKEILDANHEEMEHLFYPSSALIFSFCDASSSADPHVASSISW